MSCSHAYLTKDFGVYIPSLIKGDFSVNILSIINEKLYPSISFPINEITSLPDKKFEKLIIINKEIEKNELFSIGIKLPKKEEETEEEFDINFDLKIGNNNLTELKIPCSFKFILSSLKLTIECLNYKLLIKDNELNLGTLFLEENEVIDFKIKCLNENVKLDFKVSYKGNNENEAKEPKLIQEKNKFSINLANEYNHIDISDQNFSLKLFSATLYVYLTNDIFIPIIIKAKIIPFRFKITAYDFYHIDNPAENLIFHYYGKEQIDKEQKLFFKISMPENKRKYIGNININCLNPELKINKISLDKQFEISETKNFYIEYLVLKEVMIDIIMEIKICINSVTKKFNVILNSSPPLIERNSDRIDFKMYPEYIPLYIYKSDKHKKFHLEQINNTNIQESPNNNIFVTPYDINELKLFSFEEGYLKFLIESKGKENIFYELSNDGKFNFTKTNSVKYNNYNIDTSWGNNKISIKSFPLIGIYDDIWYPTITNFALPISTNPRFCKYNEDYLNNDEKECSQKFVNVFASNNIFPQGFRAIGNLIIQDNVFENIEEIIVNFPEEIRNHIYKDIKLNPISDEIKGKYQDSGGLKSFWLKDKTIIKGTIFEILNEKNDLKVILKNNILLSLYWIMKKRYEELKKNGFRDFILRKDEDKERFNLKVKEMREKYFCLNKEPKIPDNFTLKDELYIIKRFSLNLEKDNKKFLKNEKKLFEKIKFVHYSNKYIYTDFSNDELNSGNSSVIMEENANKNPSPTIVSDIILPKLTRLEKDITLNKLINFYNDAIRITRILPIFIRNALKKQDESMLKDAEECFSILINSYKSFKNDNNSYNKDISFLNNYVQDFINSFEKMISKLKKAGFNTFGLGLESIQSEENVNEIIKFPEFEIIDEKNSFWNIFKKKDFNDINKPFYDTFAYQKP